MRIFTFLAVTALTALSFPGSAQAKCSNMTSMEAGRCAQQYWQRADAELNRLWKRLKPQADARGTGRALLAEQRQWLKRRDGRCEQELGHGGSLDQAIYWSCMEDMTLQRNAEFRAMFR